jgi:hypothetical protein
MALEVAQTIYELAKRYERDEAHYIEITLEDATRSSVSTYIELKHVPEVPLRLTYKTASFDIGCLGDFYFVTELLLPNIMYDGMQKLRATHTTEFMSLRIQLRNANSVFAKFIQPLPDDIADLTFLNVDAWDRCMSVQNKIRCLVFMCCRLLWLQSF